MSSTTVVEPRGDTSSQEPVESQTGEGLSVVIPSYNEENGIGAVLDKLLDDLSQLCGSAVYEVIVVDDGSDDGTAEAIRQHVDSGVNLVEHDTNRGYGAALKTGIKTARFDWIVIMDADGTYPSRFLADLWARRPDNEMVVGARTGKDTHVPLIRRPPKWVLRKLACYLSNESIPDLNSGFRLMRKELVRKYFNVLPNGFSFTTTITLIMFSSGYSVEYVPIDYRKREGKSKIRPVADTIGFLKLIIRTVLYFDPIRVFTPMAFFFILAAIGVGVGSLLWAGRVMNVTTVSLFATGVQVFATGMLADLVNRRLPEA